MTSSRKNHEFSTEPSQVLRYFLIWLRGFHRDREKSKAADWALVALTFLTVVAAFVTVWLIEAQVLDSRKSTDAQIHNFKVDERGWVEIEPISPTLLSPSSDGFSAAYTCNIYAKNVGKTVAKDIEARATDIGSVDGWDENRENVERAQNMLYTESGPEAFHSHVPRVLAPNDISPVPFRLTCQAPKPFPGGHSETHYLIGKFNYCDEFNIKHWVRFCYYVVNARGEIWACKNGNDEDRNSETPTPETTCGKPS